MVRACKWIAHERAKTKAGGAGVPEYGLMPPGVDSGRCWCDSVETGSHHMVANRLLNPLPDDAGWMMDYLEDHQFLRSGWHDYPEEQNRQDVFNLGGFGKVQVRNQPTRFGPVGYKIVSHVRDGYVEASIESPTRTPPKHVVIRIRHPEGRPMKSVTVNGRPCTSFDSVAESVVLPALAATQQRRLTY